MTGRYGFVGVFKVRSCQILGALKLTYLDVCNWPTCDGRLSELRTPNRQIRTWA